jgi:uncharacterized protein YbjT (DUF2867 family)
MKDALLAGATGLIGREIAAQWTGPGKLHLLVRRPQATTHRLHRVRIVDYDSLPELPVAESAYCCLGTTIKTAGSQRAFRAVDFEAVVAFARAARAAGATRFAVVSALGANPKSSNFYSRVKGEMEAAVSGLGFTTVIIARPSLLAGNRAALGQAPRPGERLALAVASPLAGLIPKTWRPIAAATVARAMLRAADTATPGVRLIESRELQDLGA